MHINYMMSFNMKKNSGGFTLTETLIATAVVGILAAIAIPSYNYYINSAQVSEAFRLMDAQRVNTNQIHRTGSCTAVAGTPDVLKGKYGLLTISGSYTPSEGLSCPSGCNLSYTYNSSGISDKIAGKVVTAQILNNGKISKVVGSTSVPNQYLPATFRTIGVDAGDVCTRVKDDPLVPTTGTTPTGTDTGAPPPPPPPPPPVPPTPPVTPPSPPTGGTGTPTPVPPPTGTPTPVSPPSGGTGTPSPADLIRFDGAGVGYMNWHGFGSIRSSDESDGCQVGRQEVNRKLTNGTFWLKAPPDLVTQIVSDWGNRGGKWALSPVLDSNINWNIRRTKSPDGIEVIFVTYMPIVATVTKVYDSEGNSYCRWVDNSETPLTLTYEGKAIGTTYVRYADSTEPY